MEHCDAVNNGLSDVSELQNSSDNAALTESIKEAKMSGDRQSTSDTRVCACVTNLSMASL